MDYTKFDTDSRLAVQYLHKLRQLEKEIYDLEIEKSNAEHTVRSIEKSKSELEKQLSKKTHSDKELDQQRLLLLEINKSLQNSSEEFEQSKNKLKNFFYEQNKTLKELIQEKMIVTEVTKHLRNTVSDLEKSEDELKKQLSKKIHSDNESEQERLLRLEINRLLLDKIEDLQKSKDHLERKTDKEAMSLRELAQESITQNGIIKEQSIKLNKKQSLIISLAVVGGIAIVISFSLFLTVLTCQEYRVENIGNIQSGYVIQNLRGDTIDTWLSWRLVLGTVLHVGIMNTEKYPDKVQLIKEVVLSDEAIEIDDSLMHKGLKGTTSTYYVGWAGALADAAKNPTEFYIPTNLEVIESAKGEGEITIILTDEKSGDGYSGYTKNIADAAQNQILKSSVTIYEVNKLSNEEFKTILRHELGHAFGLAHSTATEDLMHPTIETNYPYISQCDISALKSLYDGGKKSEVVCEK